MLDEANTTFVNHAVTAVRYFAYMIGASLALFWIARGIHFVWKLIAPRSEEAKARQKMKDLGY